MTLTIGRRIHSDDRPGQAAELCTAGGPTVGLSAPLDFSGDSGASARVTLPSEVLDKIIERHLDLEGEYPQPVKPPSAIRDLYCELLRTGFRPITEPVLPADDHHRGSWRFDSPENRRVVVADGTAIVARGNLLLATGGLGPCSALHAAVPGCEHLQYMLHAFPKTAIGEIEASLRKAGELGIDLRRCDLALMPGDIIQSWVSVHIMTALYNIDPGIVNKLVLVRDFEAEKAYQAQGLSSRDGELYRYDKDWRGQDLNECLWRRSPTLAEDGFERVLSC